MSAMAKERARKNQEWPARNVRALRQYLGLTQQQLADELGTRQQTVSEWETGLYAPRGTSRRLLSMIAENAGFDYDVGKEEGRQREEEAGAGEAEKS
jgi:DNA-binding transcriptional regulator YiaG